MDRENCGAQFANPSICLSFLILFLIFILFLYQEVIIFFGFVSFYKKFLL